MRQSIVDLLQKFPEGLSANAMKVHLQTDKRLGDTLQGMVRQNILKRKGQGAKSTYVLA
jgi:hypothetical protein